MRLNAHMAKFPHAIFPYILVMVRRCPQYGLIAVGIGTGLQEVPGASRCVTRNFNDGIEHIVNGKRNTLARTAEELANSFTPLTAAEHPTIPYGIGSEQLRQCIGSV